jgi:uncharacterized membrane protein
MEPAEEDSPRAITWSALISGSLCLIGIAVAGYLTYAHHTTPKVLACSDKGLVNCTKVTTSSYSRVFGVPVADMGLGYFLAMAALCSPPAWHSPNRLIRGLRVAAAGAGVGMVIWLVYVELFRLDALCLYCTVVHVVTVLLFITVALGTATTAVTAAEPYPAVSSASVNDGLTR